MSTRRNVIQMTLDANPNKEMMTTTVFVTPEQAEAWLLTMPTQRRLRRTKVERIKASVYKGRWKLVPTGIALDWNGVLRDGQHRCTVVVETQVTLPMRVTVNCDPECFLAIDADSSAKTVEDVLRFAGVAKGLTNILAEPVKMLFRREQGSSVWVQEVSPSNEEAKEVFARNPDLTKAGELASRVRLSPSRSILAYYLYQGSLVDVDRTTAFANALATGEIPHAGDPAALLRNMWMQERAARLRRNNSDFGICVATALNAALRGKKLTSWRGVEFGKGRSPEIGR